jgi:hypothetical protein
MPTDTEPQPSLMDDLKASYEQLTAEPEETPEPDSPETPPAEDAAPSVETEPLEPKVDKTGRLHRPDGKFAPKEKAAEASPPLPASGAKAGAVGKPPVPTAAPVVAVPKPETPAAPAAKAPTSWKPEVREKWAALPEDVRNEVLRREREISVGLGESASHRKTAEAWTETIAPYEMMLRADGQEPQQGVAGLLQVAATLIGGPEPRKAEVLAQLFTRYGVTVDSFAKAVDRLQATAERPAVHVAPEAGAYRDPRVDQLFAHLQQQARAQQEATRAAAQQEVEEFKASDSPLAEFFDDLAEDIADELEKAHKRGKPMTVAQAAERAAKLSDSVSGVLAQRKAAAEAKTKVAELARKRTAASSIRPFPSSPPPEDGESDGSIRGDLELAVRKLTAGGRT